MWSVSGVSDSHMFGPGDLPRFGLAAAIRRLGHGLNMAMVALGDGDTEVGLRVWEANNSACRLCKAFGRFAL